MSSSLKVVLIIFVTATSATGAGHWNSRVHAAKTQALISWLDWDQMPKDMQQDEEALGEICGELLARRQVPLLLAAYTTTTNSTLRCNLVSGVLGGIDDKRIEKTLLGHVSEQRDEESYYTLRYLANRGNIKALDVLNRHYFRYPVSSLQWSSVVELFGKAKYRPAASNLVESLDAASLNVSCAACWSLEQIFPDAPKNFKGPGEAKRYYAKRLKELPNPAVQRTGASRSAGETNRISGTAGSRR